METDAVALCRKTGFIGTLAATAYFAVAVFIFITERKENMKIYRSVEELIGKTPLLELCNIENEQNVPARLLTKLEMMNPAGSAKDRVALSVLTDAEAKGLIEKGSVIIEPTSGNTGIGLAAVGAAKGYKVIIVMPDNMSVERRILMRAYGAELVLTDGSLGMSGAIAKAQELHEAIPGSVIAGQFTNPANPAAHRMTTAKEIWEDTDGKVDIVVAGIGTGGTISGIGQYLKCRNKNIKIVGVEPESSPLLTRGVSGAHGIQGIGANFVPDTLDLSVVDEIMTVTDDEAYNAGRMIAAKEGILVGISSGAALHAAVMLGKRQENAGKNIVVILPDTGERYLSSAMFAEEK